MVKRNDGCLTADELVAAIQIVDAPLLTWLAIHGNLCLALRHPANRGGSRKLVVDFVRALGAKLVERRVLTQDQLENAFALEQEEGGISESEVRP